MPAYLCCGGGEYRLRSLYYLNASVLIINFAIDAPRSLEKVEQHWIEEVKELATHEDGWKPPIMLVGCKKETRADIQQLKRMQELGIVPVTVEQGREMGNRIGAAIYLECSAKTGEGVDEVFQHAARLSLLCGDKFARQ
ncbi:GTP-binding protein Rho1 [Serendipita sp. 399]|nr:GTP-binding protein Rho1 [Serendipita sp. 399]